MSLKSGKSLSNDLARRIALDARENQQRPKILGEYLESIGNEHDEWNTELADNVANSLLYLRKQLLVADRSVTKDQKFDVAACRIVHEGLKLPLNLAADDGFWRWLVLDRFYEIVESRHTRMRDFAGLGNFGIDAPAELNRMKILWLRADIVYDANTEDPYHLACRLSPTDFWESGIIRHRYGWAPELARALVKFQYPDADSGTGTLHLTDTNGIRVLYKRLRQLHTTVAFEYLDEEQSLSILKRLSRGLL